MGKLKSIKIYNEIKPLYDIEVKDNHNFVANEILIKNSEQYLSRESLCVLASIFVSRFSTLPEIYTEELAKIGKSINRFLDNVNECELVYYTYATPHQKIAIESLRRTGAGSTDWAGWFFKQNLVYGSPEANEVAEKFNKTYNYNLYKSSIELGKEKGSFGLFNKEKYTQSPFIKHMEEQGLVFDAMRNVTCSSIAPTGTLSLMSRYSIMSYGVEPGFGIYYWKRTRISGKYEYYFNVPKLVRDAFENAGYKIPMDSDTITDTWDGKFGKPIAQFIDKHIEIVGINFKTSLEIKPLDKLEFMSKLMKDCDSSISVTYMLPQDSKWEDVYDFILQAYKKEVKSVAAFPDRKMYGIVSFMAFKDLASKLISEGLQIHDQNFSDEELEQLNLVRDGNIKSADAPKRAKVLDADIHILKVKDERFAIIIGIQNNKPYEIFGGLNNKDNAETLPNGSYKGKIIKVKRGHYSLEITTPKSTILVNDFASEYTPSEQLTFRLLSTSLRHGTPLKFLIEQMSKATDDFQSLGSAIVRVLKKYIKDGEKATGGKCPSCGSHDLIYVDGCVTCANCGWSKC